MRDKILKSEKGAASVLVIFMLLVLVTLGAFAISSANVNYKLNRRTLDWNSMYYELDGKGEEFLSKLDQKLAKAEGAAADYMTAKEYRQATHEDLPDGVQSEIRAMYMGNKDSRDEIFGKVYMHYADIYVKELLLDFSGLEVYISDSGTFIDSLLMELTIPSTRYDYELCSLVISVWAEPVEYYVADAGDAVTLSRVNNEPRYRIEDWYEYQEPLLDDGGLPEDELWDGELPEEEFWDGSL